MPVFSPDQIARYAQQARPLQGGQSSSAPPTPAGVGVAPYAALFGGQGADIATTIAALQNPSLREGNPLGEMGTIATKAAYTAMLAYLMHKLAESGHPTAAKTIGYVGGAAGAVPAVLNLRTMGQQP